MANRRLPDAVNPADPAPLVDKATSRPASPRKSPPVVMPPRAKLTPEARHALIAARGKTAPRPAVSADDRRAMIAEAAYLRAERRGFVPGQETEDWLAAEVEVDALLKAGQSSRQ